MRRFLLPILLAQALSACCLATGYHRAGVCGGYSDQQIDSKTFRVSFAGNGYTSGATVQDFLLRRCAEVTRNAGFDYFVIVNGASGVSTSYYVTRNQYGGYVTPVNKPSSSLLIQVFKGTKPEDPNAFDAADVLAHLQH